MAPALSAHRIRHSAKPVARRSHCKGRPAKSRAAGTGADGFLNKTFPPLVSDLWPYRLQQAKVEEGFFESLRHLCKLYDVAIPEATGAIYPYNIASTLEYLRSVIDKNECSVEIVEKTDGTVCLATVKYFPYSEGFFIPVQPLVHLLKNEVRPPTVQLIWSLMAWLYQTIQVPYFGDASSYVCYNYQLTEEMMEHNEGDYDPEYLAELQAESKAMWHYAARIHRQISSPYHLVLMEQRICQYEPNTLLEAVLHIASLTALRLYQSYPNRSIYHRLIQSPGGRLDDETMSLEQYLSFHWNWHCVLGEQLYESLNCDFQNTMEVQEPAAVQLFDRPQSAQSLDLGFEKNLFKFLDQFIYVLNSIV